MADLAPARKENVEIVVRVKSSIVQNAVSYLNIWPAVQVCWSQAALWILMQHDSTTAMHERASRKVKSDWSVNPVSWSAMLVIRQSR